MSSSSTHSIYDLNENLLTSWLKQQGAVYKAPLQTVILVSLAIFGLQVSAFWWLASIAGTMIAQSGSPEINDLRYLGVTIVLILLLTKIKDGMVGRIHHRICVSLQSQLQHQMEGGSYAVIPGESPYFWQQLWLDHIPAVGNYVTYYSIQKRIAAITPLIAITMIWPVNWVVALTFLVTIPTLPLFTYLVGKGAANQHRRHFASLEKMGSLFVDRLKSLSLLEVFNTHKPQETLEDTNEQLNKETMKVVSMAFLSSTVLDFFSLLAVALIAVFVGFSLLGELNLGEHIGLHKGLFLLLVAPQIFAELKKLGKLYHQKANAVAAAQNLIPLYENKYSKQTQSLGDFNHLHWQDFKGVSPTVQIDGISLEQGDWVLLTGPSGAGKSVFLEALAGQHPPSPTLNCKVAMLNHNVDIQPTTLRKNLTLDHYASDETLELILEAVCLLEWVNCLPEGLDTRMNEESLVSGEQQRIALARILLSNASIIILDDPTAHITDEMHDSISEVIRENFRDKTVIWATHNALPEQWFNRHWRMDNLRLFESKSKMTE